MKTSIFAAAMVIATSSVAASAQDAPAESAEPKEEKKICRTERATGSLTRRTRICMTAAQWRELNSRTKKGLDEMQRGAAGGTAVANNPGPGGM